MFRSGEKLASYKALAAALALVQARDWSLNIIGDGPVRGEVKTLFSGFTDKVTFEGALGQDEVARAFRNGDLLVWPGVGEAFGMVYLEAQAQGCPVLAEDRPGVRDVVRDGGWLVPVGDPAAYAAAIDAIISDAEGRLATGRRGRERVAAEHLLPAARTTLSDEIRPLLSER
jgi:glycosyltransferase involved in cell wall biosynthesis